MNAIVCLFLLFGGTVNQLSIFWGINIMFITPNTLTFYHMSYNAYINKLL